VSDVRVLQAKVGQMRAAAGKRDSGMRDIRSVRSGEIEKLAPDLFSEEWPKALVANSIDVMARDMAEMLAPLPALNCASGAMKTDADKARAAKKNKIGSYIWQKSKLKPHMYVGADQFVSYGFLPFYVEPDFDCSLPIITLDDPYGAYYENDRFGRTRVYVKIWRDSAQNLAAMFPEHRVAIMTDDRMTIVPGTTELELVRYCDDKQTTLFLLQRGVVLSTYANPLDCCPARVIEWPGLIQSITRGRFQDLIWVQIARGTMASLAMKAGWDSVNAPIQVPKDANELVIGPNAIFRTDGQVRRVPLEIPQSAFALEQTLNQELQAGARYPGARSGDLHSSIITGRGVQELLGSFDSQIRMAQDLLGEGLTAATELALEMLEKLFPGSRTVNGSLNGESYRLTFDPGADINGNYTCDIEYGFASGLSPQNAVVMLLQLRGDNLIDRDTVRRQLPWPIDVEQTQREIDVQEMRDGLRQGVAATAQSIGAIAQAGQDPSPMLRAISMIIQGRRDGRPLEALVEEAFAPEPQPQDAAEATGAAPGGEAVPGGLGPDGLPPGVAPGQAGRPPGGMPDILSLMAGLRSGRPVMDASVLRKVAV
jgi:hypothetical protein